MNFDSVNPDLFNIQEVKEGLREYHALGFTLDDLRFLPSFRVDTLKNALKEILDVDSGDVTFEQLADVAPKLLALKIKGIGAGQERQLKAALMLISRHGFHHFAADGHLVPRNLQEFVDTGLALLPEDERKMLIAWVVLNQSGDKVAPICNLNSRQAVDIRLKNGIRPAIMDRIGWFGKEYIKPLRYLFKLSGGVCHVDSLNEVYGDVDPQKIVLACWLCSDDKRATVNLWKETFLLEQPRTIFETRIGGLRRLIRDRCESDAKIAVGTIQKILVDHFGIRLEAQHVESLMTVEFDVEPDADGIFDVSKLQFRGERIVTHLKKMGKPLHCKDLALPMYQISNDRDPETEEDLEGYGRRAESILERSEDVVQWKTQTFIHVDNLPITKDQINELQALAVNLVLKKQGTTSIKDIVRALKDQLPWIKDYDPYLIKDLVCRDGRVKKMRKYLLAPAEMEYDTSRSILLDETRDLLEAEDRQMTAEEVFQIFQDKGLCFSIYSLSVGLARNDFSVNLGNGTFLALKHLGIDSVAVAEIQRLAFDRFKDGDVQIHSARQILNSLRDHDAVATLVRKHGDSAASVLWGILRLDSDRFATGAWNAVAIRKSPDDDTRVVSSEIVYLALKRLSVAFTSDLRDEIESWWGWKVNPGSLEATLNKLKNEGRIARFPFRVYYPVDVEKGVLFEKLSPFKSEIYKIVENGLVSDLSDPQWKIADEFFLAMGDYSLAGQAIATTNG